MSNKTWLFGLTADEWLHLAAEGEDSEVPPCCANMSDFRELLNALAVSQGPNNGWVKVFSMQLLDHPEIKEGGHELDNAEQFPLLHRVLAGAKELVGNKLDQH